MKSFSIVSLPPQPEPDNVKPFALVKYFTFTSLILMFLGAIVLSTLNTHWGRSMLQKKSEDYALLLVENLNHQVFLQFIIPVAFKYGKIQLRNQDQFERMDKLVRSTLHSFNVDTVNFYDMNNIISYSFDKDIVGVKDFGGTGYLSAIEGKSTSSLIQIGSFWELLLGTPKASKIRTYAPIRAEKPLSTLSGPVLGVVEIVLDVSDDYKEIIKLQKLVIATSSAVMGILFVILNLVVKRGEGIIHARTQERLRLKEELSRAMHLSSLGEMTAAISHEIRNPLGIIRSSAELLQKKIKRIDPENSIPDIIVEESGRLNNIITDFLDFARPRTPIKKKCSIDEIIEKNITYLTPQLEKGDYSISKFCAKIVPEVQADDNMLYQAFLNIMINAMQAMPGGGKIHVGIYADKKEIKVVFEDNGDGIPENLMDKIREPFFTTKEKGTGLGLGIVANIIESHGGDMSIENRQTCGARVTVRIPV